MLTGLAVILRLKYDNKVYMSINLFILVSKMSINLFILVSKKSLNLK